MNECIFWEKAAGWGVGRKGSAEVVTFGKGVRARYEEEKVRQKNQWENKGPTSPPALIEEKKSREASRNMG